VIETVVLALSGWVFQWRDDSHWRELNQAQYNDELAGLFEPRADDWVRWTGTLYRQARRHSAFASAGWQLLYDELPAGATARVVLANASEPPITVLGGIWMSEWIGGHLPATVTVGSQSWILQQPRVIPNFHGEVAPETSS
jgi:hypothetical protein